MNIDTINEETKPLKDESNEAPEKLISLLKLFSFASKSDKIFIYLGVFAACSNGTLMPVFSILFGRMASNFGPQNSIDEIMDTVAEFALIFLYVGLGAFALSMMMMSSWIIVGESQGMRIKQKYAEALLLQEIEWFDKSNPNDLITKISEECTRVQEAVGEKVGTFLMTISMFIAGIVIGFIEGWQISLILTGAIPLLAFATFLFVYVIQQAKKVSETTYSVAGGRASQAFFSIKTVKGLIGEDHEINEYGSMITFVKGRLIRFGFFSAFAMGLLYFAMNATYSLGFYSASYAIEQRWYNHVKDRDWDVGTALSSFFAIIFAAFSLGQASPALSAFAKGRISGTSIFKLINRVPKILIDDANKKTVSNLQGEIEFSGVDFYYPLRPEVKVLSNLNLKVSKGQKIAFVGESGCGKSTTFQLLERFYDPNFGSITIDGVEIRDYNLRSMRYQIGFVGQEPILFEGTIRENLLFGKHDASDEDMKQSLQQANAWDFVSKLTQGLDTHVGTAGSQLSGGQKQRIAIARALIKNPNILLLDEATSALDRTNELAIQKTLDEISKGRTTLVIAHRLSTIQDADVICFFKEGEIVERGSHAELMQMNGGYAKIFERQISNVNEVEEIQEKAEPELEEIPLLKKQSSVEGHSRKASTEEETIKNISKQEKKNLSKRLSDYTKQNWKALYFGYFSALINGATFPFIGVFLAEIMNVLADPNVPSYRENADFYCGMFLLLAAISLLANTFQLYFLEIAGQSMIISIRKDLFSKMINMPVKFFDDSNHSPGALASLLASDANYVYSMTAVTKGMGLMTFSSFLTGTVIAFTATWELTLLNFGLSPLLFISAMFQAAFAEGFSKDFDEFYKDANEIIFEGITNIRTVNYLTADKLIIKHFEKKMELPKAQIRTKGFKAGLAFGFSNFVMFAIYAILFYVGAVLMRDRGLSYENLFKSIFALMFAAFATGNAAQFMPDMGKGFAAAKRIFTVLDSESEFEEEKRINPDALSKVEWGDIEFKNVSFAYPLRINHPVLKNISFKIKYGEKVAFVGASGSGKSTILQLLQRFYEVNEGSITINGIEISKFNKKGIRNEYGIVSQEPVLFNESIRYNIKYNTQNVTEDDIVKASKMANAYDFIMNDQNFNDKSEFRGFYRKVGLKGGNISGGQKQRLAIARAILKNPTILLLDEATSALDANSEHAVQETLDKLMENQTTIIVAHRISTIKNADRIFVLDGGVIVEEGNYNQLVENKGVFYRLERGIQM